jgi:hypothetical protein
MRAPSIPTPASVRPDARGSHAQELLEQKKRLHCAAFSCILDELARELDSIAGVGDAEARLARDPNWGKITVKKLLERILQRVKDVAKRHNETQAEVYVDDGEFKRLVHEMLDARTAAVSFLHLYLEDESQYVANVQDLTLREAHRSLIAHSERALLSLEGEALRAEAEKVCAMQGLVRSSALEADEAGEGPLERAAADGSVGPSRVKLLLAAGVSAVDRSRALLAAARYGQIDAADALIGALGAESVNARDPVRLPYPGLELRHTDF